MVKKILQAPIVNLLAGVILIVTACSEVIGSWGTGGLGVHHGVALFGLLHVLRVLPEVVEGLADIEEGQRRRRSRDGAGEPV